MPKKVTVMAAPKREDVEALVARIEKTAPLRWCGCPQATEVTEHPDTIILKGDDHWLIEFCRKGLKTRRAMFTRDREAEKR